MSDRLIHLAEWRARAKIRRLSTRLFHFHLDASGWYLDQMLKIYGEDNIPWREPEKDTGLHVLTALLYAAQTDMGFVPPTKGLAGFCPPCPDFVECFLRDREWGKDPEDVQSFFEGFLCGWLASVSATQ